MSSYHPQTNGSVERHHRQLLTFLASHIVDMERETRSGPTTTIQLGAAVNQKPLGTNAGEYST